jgi:clan AA aspartic protease
MGIFTEEITLTNAGDLVNARAGFIPESGVRRISVMAMPDTGARTLIFNEETRQKLGLKIVEMVESSLADGSTTKYGLTEPVEVCWKDRRTSQEAVVIPEAGEILLGAMPLEGMDLYVDPVNQRLAGVHGDRRIHLVL